VLRGNGCCETARVAERSDKGDAGRSTGKPENRGVEEVQPKFATRFIGFGLLT